MGILEEKSPLRLVWSDWAVFVSTPVVPARWPMVCGVCRSPCGFAYALNSATRLVLCPWCAASVGVADLDAFQWYAGERSA